MVMEDNTAMSEDLERVATLEECEAVIEHGLQTFYEVGVALMTIRDQELFRKKGYPSFAAYCRKRWTGGIAQSYRLIEAAKVVQNVSPRGEGSIQCEAQMRPLTRLSSPEDQQSAWGLAVERAAPQVPTRQQVDDIVRTQFENRPTQAQEQAERRAREAEERAEQLLKERREAEEAAQRAQRERRAAEQRTEELLKERDDVRMGRYMLYSGLVEAVRRIASFHVESAADAWDGISAVLRSDEFLDDMERAQRCLTRLKVEHPNAVRKPARLLQKPS
jgi:hypothetical protein